MINCHIILLTKSYYTNTSIIKYDNKFYPQLFLAHALHHALFINKQNIMHLQKI